MAKKAVPAVSYLRVSGKGQAADDRDGFPRQREATRKYAAAAGFEIVAEYSDAESGTRELDDRDGLSDLLARLRANGVRVVLVERADRLARDLMVSELILTELRKLGAIVLDASGNELTAADGDPTRTLIRQVLAAVAQFEKSVIVSKLKAARVRKRRASGRCEGRKPFGTKAGELDTLARMRTLARKPRMGVKPSLAAVAAALNAEGRRTRTGRPWSATVVRRILARSTPVPASM